MEIYGNKSLVDLILTFMINCSDTDCLTSFLVKEFTLFLTLFTL